MSDKHSEIKKRERIDSISTIVFKLSGILTISILTGIFLMLIYNSISFFKGGRALDFFTGFQWDPGTNKGKFGIIPLTISTAMVSIGAMVIAVPIGILTAVFISEVVPGNYRLLLKSIVEILASIPSVAIGFLGIVIIGPGIAEFFGLQNGLNAINGSVLLSIMALPTIITISEDAIKNVPNAYREASLALGANKWETIFKVILPASIPGILAAVLLGLGRAIGETMTVLMATGNSAAIPTSFFDSVRTITATIAIEMGEVPYQTTHYFALFAIAAVLFIITLIINLIGEHFSKKYRKLQI